VRRGWVRDEGRNGVAGVHGLYEMVGGGDITSVVSKCIIRSRDFHLRDFFMSVMHI